MKMKTIATRTQSSTTSRRREVVVNVDPTDVEALFYNDHVWLAEVPAGTEITVNIECGGHAAAKFMPHEALAEYLMAARNAERLASLSDNMLMAVTYARQLFEAEARRRVERARQRERAIARFGPSDWESADLLAEVEAICGPLVKRGREWWTLCPFHAERTPSFAVNAEKRVWRCYGCGRGGGVLDWRRAVREVAA